MRMKLRALKRSTSSKMMKSKKSRKTLARPLLMNAVRSLTPMSCVRVTYKCASTPQVSYRNAGTTFQAVMKIRRKKKARMQTRL